MATVKQCDRCGAIYERDKDKNDHFAFDKPSHEIGFEFVIADLCPKCNNELLDWINAFDQSSVEKIISIDHTENCGSSDFRSPSAYSSLPTLDAFKSFVSQAMPNSK